MEQPNNDPPQAAGQADNDDKKKKAEEKKKQKEAEKAAKLAKLKEKEAKLALEQQRKEEKAKIAAESGQPDKKKEKEKVIRLKQDFVNLTPPGQKKDMNAPMEESYNPPAVEASWYDWWVASGFFSPEYQRPYPNPHAHEHFVMVIPPPNVTGSLHLGHALTNSVEDTLVRWHRMKGHTTLWVPGTDHAGIATQTVVEKKLMRERGIKPKDLGRENFVAEVWKWKEQYGNRITSQLKRIGSSLDWNREVFTLDARLSGAVQEAFIRMFNGGLIYRDTRLVNWCCALQTAISDIEVDAVELEGRTERKVPNHDDNNKYEFGIIVEFAYKVVGSDEEIVVATTRPETMLADTAVAVHPDDARYKHLHGKLLQHPFVDRQIPIIADGVLVDMAFGTGAVKVTPAHDPNDYECGRRNGLSFINLLTDTGDINENGGPFQGMKRFDCRNALVAALKEKGLYRGIKDNKMSLKVCSRSKDVIEPRIKPQWYVRCDELAKKAMEATNSGELQIFPEEHRATWDRWMSSIRDWCISRQLWWGHRIPAYHISFKGQPPSEDGKQDFWVVGRSTEEAAAAAAQKTGQPAENLILVQDEDVLDTWFSSGLFPFSVFGWPNATADLAKFYPTTMLETGYDILFFWVARMVMMGQYLTGQLPFKQVFLHPLVRDAHGRKMSKSLGNVIDPIDMIEGITLERLQEALLAGNLDPREVAKATETQKQDFPHGITECGTDAMRFGLCAYLTQGGDINLNVNRIEGYRQFCNKLWNATRFSLMKLEDGFEPMPTPEIHPHSSPVDKWIMSRLAAAITACEQGFRRYDFASITTAIYSFCLYELCDVYLEAIKPVTRLPSDAPAKQAAQQTLYTCVETALLLLHPFMPFLSEELYQRLPRRVGSLIPSICVAPYPIERPDWANPEVEAHMQLAQDIIHGILSLRATYNIIQAKRPTVSINTHNAELQAVCTHFSETIKALSFSGGIAVTLNAPAQPGWSVNVINENIEAYLDIRELVDIGAEIQRLEQKRNKIIADRETLLKKTTAPGYDKVPQKLKDENIAKLAAFESELGSTSAAIDSFSSLRQ